MPTQPSCAERCIKTLPNLMQKGLFIEATDTFQLALEASNNSIDHLYAGTRLLATVANHGGAFADKWLKVITDAYGVKENAFSNLCGYTNINGRPVILAISAPAEDESIFAIIPVKPTGIENAICKASSALNKPDDFLISPGTAFHRGLFKGRACGIINHSPENLSTFVKRFVLDVNHIEIALSGAANRNVPFLASAMHERAESPCPSLRTNLRSWTHNPLSSALNNDGLR